MKGITHMTAGLVSAMAIAPDDPKAIALITLGSILPDIDHGGSFIGRKIPWISKFVRHRGMTHSLFATILIYSLNPWLGIGYASHIILDMLTIQGVRLFFPFKGMYGFKVIKTGGTIEYTIRTILVGCFFIILYNNI